MESVQSAQTQQPSALPLPTPPDFPITWEQPGDEHGFWTTDPMHFPDPLLPLEDALIRLLYHAGFKRSAEAYDLPVRFHARRFNTYHYSSIAPITHVPEELEALGKSSEQKIGAAMAQQMVTWTEIYLPEIRRDIEAMAAVDFDAAPTEQLRAYVARTLELIERHWEIHFRVALPFLMAPSLFEEFYREVFGEESALNAYRLLQGLDNLTARMGRELWRLSRDATRSDEVKQTIISLDAAEVVPALRESDAGRQFLTRLDEFLAEFGHRGTGLGITTVTWIEDPTDVIRMLKEYVVQPDHDPDAELAHQAAERERLVAEARQRLAAYPEAVRGQFEFLLKAAQDAVVIHEDHGYWIDFRSMYEARRVFLAAGRRLVELGVTAAPDDIYYLSFDEVLEALGNPAGTSLRAEIAARRAEVERFRQITPPPAVGVMPPGPPPDNPLFRAVSKFFGTPPQPSGEPDLLKGAPGSAGLARGTVRVISSLSEADRLEPGDILVAKTTTPPWTPLFGTAGAVVTDSGGPLSHCALVAREYGIPAVVGVGMATAVLKDGQQVEVDGTAGTVRIL